MFSAFRRGKASSTHPLDHNNSPHNSHGLSGQLKQLKDSFKQVTNDFNGDPMRVLICHIIECIQIMSTVPIPESGPGSKSTKSISNVVTVCNSTFYDVMEIILAEVFCVQPAYQLSDAESRFCNAVGCHIARLYPTFLSRALNERTKKTLLHIVSQQPVNGLETVSFVHQMCPVQASKPDASGALPLHYAAHSLHQSQSEIVQYLLGAYPEGARVADNEGYLPLHWAVNSKAQRLDSVRTLLKLYPEGARQQCSGGTLPLHWAVDRDDIDIEVIRLLHEENPQAHHIVSMGDWLPLHRCVDRDNVNHDVLQFLIQQNPKGLLKANIDGHLPLHRLVDRENVDVRALELLIRACPDSLSVPDLEGYLPLHTLLEAYSAASGLTAFNMLLQAYPDAASLATTDGLCPLHCAMCIGQEWNIAVLQALVSAYPNGCVEEAVDTEPEDPEADPMTYTGRWRKFKWTPLSRATEVGNKHAIDLLKKAINKMALQKMTQKKLSAVSPKQKQLRGPEDDGDPSTSTNSQPVKLKSGQLAAIASKQPKQGPVVLPRPHMKGGHMSAHRMSGLALSETAADGEARSVVLAVEDGEFGLADIHGTSSKIPPKASLAADIDLPDAVHVEDSDWVDDEVAPRQVGLPRNPDLVARET